MLALSLLRPPVALALDRALVPRTLDMGPNAHKSTQQPSHCRLFPITVTVHLNRKVMFCLWQFSFSSAFCVCCVPRLMNSGWCLVLGLALCARVLLSRVHPLSLSFFPFLIPRSWSTPGRPSFLPSRARRFPPLLQPARTPIVVCLFCVPVSVCFLSVLFCCGAISYRWAVNIASCSIQPSCTQQ